MIEQDVYQWMAGDIAEDERLETDEDFDSDKFSLRVAELLQDPTKLKEMWENESRYEMVHDEPRIEREFVLQNGVDEDDGYRATMVYHVVPDDFTN